MYRLSKDLLIPLIWKHPLLSTPSGPTMVDSFPEEELAFMIKDKKKTTWGIA